MIDISVELIKWDKSMKKALAEICSGTERTYLSGRLPQPYTEKDAAERIKTTAQTDGKSGLYRAILYEGRAVGSIAVEQGSDVHIRDAEIGYMLLPEFSGRGIMTEAVGKLCSLAFETLDIVRVTAIIFSPNTASRRVLEKNGFTLEDVRKRALFKNGEFYDLCIYGKLK